MKRTSLFTLAILMIAAVSALGQVHGDYRSAVSGNWGTASTWQTYDTVSTSWIAATVQPTSANNVTIQTGDSVRVEVGGKNCLNLTIQSTAKLYTTSSTNAYVNIYGGTITNDGVMGGTTDGLSITACYAADLLFQGSGTTDISRLRPTTGQSGRTITIDMDMNLHFVGSSLYCNSSSTMTFNINAGKTLSFAPGSFFAMGTSPFTPTSGVGDVTINVIGTIVFAAGSNFNPSVTVGNTSTVNIDGTIIAGDSIMANGTGSEIFYIHSGGQLLFTTTDTLVFLDTLYFNEPAGFAFNYPLTIAGKLAIINGVIDSAHNIKMLNNSTIERHTGLLSEAPIFMNAVNLIYAGAAACTTGYEVPTADSLINDVTFKNSNGVVLSRPMRCYGSVLLEDGIVHADTDTNYLGCMNQPGRVNGYVDGFLGMRIPAGDTTMTFHVGTANGYSPASIYFDNVTTEGGMAVSAHQSTHPYVNISANSLQRYWHIGTDPVTPPVFDSCQIAFTYLAADFNTGFMEAGDEGSMTVGKYDDTNWTFPAVSGRTPAGIADGGNITVSGVTSFSEFTMAKDQDAIFAGDTVAPYIVSTYPANGATEVALNTLMYVAFSEAVDTLSADGTINPVPSPSYPTWNPTMDTMFYVHGDLEANTTYTLAFTALNDLAGNPLAVLPDSFSFTTVIGDTIKPYIISTYPADGDSGVALNTPVVIAFSESMDTASIIGYAIPTDDYSLSWSAGWDTLTLTPGISYNYNTTYSVIITAATDIFGNSLAILPDTFVTFTTLDNQGPNIALVQQPEDTYDGAGPFLVRAVLTDPAKAGITTDTLWYTNNKTDWWAFTHTAVNGDTFDYSIPGPFAPGTVIEYFFGAWDDGGAVQYDPGMYRGYQFRILAPLPPSGLAAIGQDMSVDLSWAPPAEVIDYSNSNGTGFFWDANDIITTRFTPQHYPCKLEQVVSSWWNAIGTDSVDIHIWADDGDGLPDRSVELVPPRVVLPLDYPSYTVIDISSENLVLSSGDFHVGYVIRTDNYPMPMCDSDGPGIRSLVYDSSATTWGNMVSGGTYHDWAHQAVVSYSNYSKGLALKSYVPKLGDKSLPKLADTKTVTIAIKQAPVYPNLTGALFLAKNITGYDIMRGAVSGGPYSGLAKINDTTYTDNTVLNNNTYYYVVRALYASPDTFSTYSNEASATPTGVEGKPGTQSYSFYLMPASPNPVKGPAEFRFGLAKDQKVNLEIYNVLGQRVKTLVNGVLPAGNHAVKWNGCDDNGLKVSSGVYVYQLKAGGQTLTRRLAVIR